VNMPFSFFLYLVSEVVLKDLTDHDFVNFMLFNTSDVCLLWSWQFILWIVEKCI